MNTAVEVLRARAQRMREVVLEFVGHPDTRTVAWVTDWQSKSGTCTECAALDGEVMTLAVFKLKQASMHGGSDTCRCLWQFANSGQYVSAR